MSDPLEQLSQQARDAMPRHVAIIMDGNGRWAKQRRFPPVSYTHLRAHET